MRRLPRLQQSIDLLLESTGYPHAPSTMCRTCRLRAASQARRAAFSTSAPRYKGSLTDRLRNRLFKKEDAPGTGNLAYGVAQPQAPEVEVDDSVPGEEAPREYANQYEPASTWDNLEWVGGKKSKRDRTDTREEVQWFMPRTKATKPNDIAAAVRRALVEVLSLQEAGVHFEALRLPTVSIDDLAAEVQYQFSTNGHDVRLKYPSNEVKSELLGSVILSIPDAAEVAGSESSDAAASLEFQSTSAVVHEPASGSGKTLPWKEVPLNSANKFAVGLQSDNVMYMRLILWQIIKRVMQLTGIRLADPKIQRCDTAGKLFHELLQRPKPTKLADALKIDNELTTLNNVTFSSRRVGPIDKERQVGRWKVIERELENRGLPVTMS
ncbi:hypothetical protein H2201_007181 [Coniosporium apollinis]|uniref:Large ribosomal subunit protein mL50 n=1 Tax=Coniosporium apollinis TaxID=61459 RepID=A0ABQ9NNF9_9PEZI|nr:hypothetical protein H2201_007181 [Coniosporium apollinis]